MFHFPTKSKSTFSFLCYSNLIQSNSNLLISASRCRNTSRFSKVLVKIQLSEALLIVSKNKNTQCHYPTALYSLETLKYPLLLPLTIIKQLRYLLCPIYSDFQNHQFKTAASLIQTTDLPFSLATCISQIKIAHQNMPFIIHTTRSTPAEAVD